MSPSMNKLGFQAFLPGLLAILALLVIVAWLSTGPIERLQARVPGMDRDSAAPGSVEPVSRDGQLVRSEVFRLQPGVTAHHQVS